VAYQGIKPLLLAHQYVALRTDWPEGDVRHDKNGLSWTGFLTPTALGRHYPVLLRYASLNHAPQMHVLGNVLKEVAPGRRIPHLYCQRTERLCLYTPKLREWLPHMRLSRTMLPWAALWLLYFEDWVATDIWMGGGTHPTPVATNTFSKTILTRLQ
jgi:hypothetical protein